MADGAIGYTRVERFSSEGRFLNSWGSNGAGPGEFAEGQNGPVSVAVNANGVYVTDPGNHRVQQFSASGTFIREWSTTLPADPLASYPLGISSAPDGSVWVTTDRARVQQFTSTGTFVKQWFAPGNSFEDVVVTTAGVYISDVNHNRVLRYDTDGNLLGSFGSFGSSPAQFNQPWGIGAGLTDASVLVANQEGDRVQRFAASGAFLATFGSSGSALGRFNTPRDITAGPNQHVYVSDLNNNRVVHFDLSPQARIKSKPIALTGEAIEFDASASINQLAPITRYEWDFDGDGTFEVDSGPDPTVSHTFTDRKLVKVAVRASAGSAADVASALLDVRLDPPSGELGASINDGAIATNDPDVDVALVWPLFTDGVLLSNDGGFGGALTQSFAIKRSVRWRLRSSGPERLPKTVYVRFRGGEAGRETYTDDIILDETRPLVTSARLVTPRASQAAAAGRKGRRSRVQLKASDNAAGVVRYQLAKNRRNPQRPKRIAARKRRVVKTIAVRSSTRRLHVRVQDAAGNWSKWRSIQRKASRR